MFRTSVVEVKVDAEMRPSHGGKTTTTRPLNVASPVRAWRMALGSKSRPVGAEYASEHGVSNRAEGMQSDRTFEVLIRALANLRHR